MDAGRNDPCPCGSGKKFKNCCLGKRGGGASALSGMPAAADIAALALGALALASAFTLQNNYRFSDDFTKNVGYIEEATDRFRAAAPAFEGGEAVGYLDDEDGPRDVTNVERNIQYHLAQYALLPRILASDAERPLVLGNFRRGIDPARVASLGFEAAKTPGEKVWALRRKKS